MKIQVEGRERRQTERMERQGWERKDSERVGEERRRGS